MSSNVKYLFIVLIICSCGNRSSVVPQPKTVPKSDSEQENKQPKKSKTQKKTINEPKDPVGALIAKQQANFPSILNELKTQKKKTSHWIWWVFPTEMAGGSEPLPKTSVQSKDADALLSKADLTSWTAILTEIFDLLEKAAPKKLMKNGNKPDSNIIPGIDHGRISYALDFWLVTVKETTKKHANFYAALKALKRFDWN